MSFTSVLFIQIAKLASSGMRHEIIQVYRVLDNTVNVHAPTSCNIVILMGPIRAHVMVKPPTVYR